MAEAAEAILPDRGAEELAAAWAAFAVALNVLLVRTARGPLHG